MARCLASETTDPHYPGPHRHDLPWLRPSTAIRLTDGHAQDEANGPPSTRGYDVEYGIDEIECAPVGCGARGTPVNARLRVPRTVGVYFIATEDGILQYYGRPSEALATSPRLTHHDCLFPRRQRPHSPPNAMSFSFMYSEIPCPPSRPGHTAVSPRTYVQASPAAALTEPALLDAPERNRRLADEARVRADHADLERLRDAPHAPDVAREEVAREADGRRVREPHDLLLALEPRQRRERPERLLRVHERALGHVREHCGREERACARDPLAPVQELRALCERVLDVSLDLLDGAVVDEGAVGAKVDPLGCAMLK